MSAEAIALAFRAGLPFVGLRDHEHDAELDRIVPPDAARAARVVPLSGDGEGVRLAVADPSADLSALATYLEGRRVELVVADRGELDEVLGPPPSPEAAPSSSEEEVAAEPPASEDPPLAAPAPQRRRRGVVVTLLVVLVLLVVAGAVAAYLLAG